jgi:hypothetical protein
MKCPYSATLRVCGSLPLRTSPFPYTAYTYTILLAVFTLEEITKGEFVYLEIILALY